MFDFRVQTVFDARDRGDEVINSIVHFATDTVEEVGPLVNHVLEFLGQKLVITIFRYSSFLKSVF